MTYCIERLLELYKNTYYIDFFIKEAFDVVCDFN